MKENERIFEVDLYPPIQKHFVKLGYEVYGEVRDCDIAAVKDDELIIVEMKLRLNMDLLVQATKRQKMTNLVYIAIPRPTHSLRSKKWRDLCHLVRRLELGLILVSFRRGIKRVDIQIDPVPFDRKRSKQSNKKKRELLIREVAGRHGDYNIGGSTGTKILTAYKESCIKIGCYLDKFGPLSPKALREMGTGEKTLSILNKNYYGWFERVQRGIYSINDTGKKDLNNYSKQIEHYLKELG
ncbi:DUF2161 domain-containing phosphodiesterase [Falsibacillus albus]|uniref:Uncharacterized protein n=1 Tax=Falsibacillus albus TaxID=2478915 RepID=A0A3L7JVU8_9BACI|nr:DUF2161 family putative PD-(D/E)XK-type phosphodiesterase [Falsibacillus albus]RLQ94239.1 hypothetical protein D9X91_14330 [Falsibacillus albus]